MNSSTQNHESLVDRNLPARILQPLGQMACILDRAVDYGANVFSWCGPETAGKSGALFPPLMLLYHAMEAADAVSILLRGGAVDPATAVLRSELEATIYVYYMLDNDTEKRGRAFRFARQIRKLFLLDQIDPAKKIGQEAAERLAADALMKEHKRKIDPKLTAAERKAAENAIALPDYDDIRETWKAMGKRKYPPVWQELAGGPKSIAQLAGDAKCGGLYDIFYSHFSEEIHCGNAMESARAFPNGRAAIQPIRHPAKAQLCWNLSITILVGLYQRMVQRFCPENEAALKKWYEELFPEIEKSRAFNFIPPPPTEADDLQNKSAPSAKPEAL